jgi:predicted dehydrogenase
LDHLLSEGGIDAVYIANPHSEHKESAFTAVDHGIPVLVEKPLTTSGMLTEELLNYAKKKKVLIMEALWSKFHPLIRQIWDYIDHGYLGSVRSMSLRFGFAADFHPDGRLFNPRLGGGATLDVGIYPLWLPVAFWGNPVDIKTIGRTASTGVDAASISVLGFSGGGIASCESSIVYPLDNRATISGTRGYISIYDPWYAPRKAELFMNDGRHEVWNHRARSTGLCYEVEHFQNLVESGSLESPIHGLDDMLMLAQVMDRVLSGI